LILSFDTIKNTIYFSNFNILLLELFKPMCKDKKASVQYLLLPDRKGCHGNILGRNT